MKQADIAVLACLQRRYLLRCQVSLWSGAGRLAVGADRFPTGGGLVFRQRRKTVPLCQLQITTWRPHSINLNCMAHDGQLFISCSNCAGKQWSNNALSHPHGKLRAASVVYPVTLTRVTDPEGLDLCVVSTTH